MFKTAAVCVMSGALLVGCGSEQTREEELIEIKANLIQAGFPESDIQRFGDEYYVGMDGLVSLEASREMIQTSAGTTDEQYRTSNLVGSSVSKICIIPTSAFNSYSRLSAGLDAAIANYNGLGLRLTFVRGNPGGCTATISARTTSGTGGSAGFPSGGKPYGTINIGTGLQSYSVDVNEHVITHELGHCIGMRHSDYYDRSISCGSGGNEGSGGVGAIHIPGTPTDARVGGSIMNSCFRSNESGEFTSSDRTAFNYLY